MFSAIKRLFRKFFAKDEAKPAESEPVPAVPDFVGRFFEKTEAGKRRPKRHRIIVARAFMALVKRADLGKTDFYQSITHLTPDGAEETVKAVSLPFYSLDFKVHGPVSYGIYTSAPVHTGKGSRIALDEGDGFSRIKLEVSAVKQRSNRTVIIAKTLKAGVANGMEA